MKLKYHPDARDELRLAAEEYEACRIGLGIEFVEEIQAAIQRILEFPRAWAPLSERTRRCLTNRFPYGIIYQVWDHELRIIAVAHQSRAPGYWKNRLEP